MFMTVIISKQDTSRFEEIQKEFPDFFRDFEKDTKLYDCYRFHINTLFGGCFSIKYADFIPKLVSCNINFIVIDHKTYELICSDPTYLATSFLV